MALTNEMIDSILADESRNLLRARAQGRQQARNGNVRGLFGVSTVPNQIGPTVGNMQSLLRKKSALPGTPLPEPVSMMVAPGDRQPNAGKDPAVTAVALPADPAPAAAVTGPDAALASVGRGALRGSYVNPDEALMAQLDQTGVDFTSAERAEVTPVLRRMDPAITRANGVDDYEAAREKLQREGVRGVVIGPAEMQQPYQGTAKPKAVFDPARVAGALADAEQGLLRRTAQAPAADPNAPAAAPAAAPAPGTVAASPALMAAREKQKLAMADDVYGFQSPMTRQRIAGREQEARQDSLMRTKQANDIELIQEQGKLQKVAPPTVNVLRNRKFDPETGKPIEEWDTADVRNSAGARLNDAGVATTPMDVQKDLRQQSVAKAIAEVDQVTKDLQGGLFNIGMRGSDAAAQKKIDAAVLNAATAALGKPASPEDLAAIKQRMAAGQSLADILALAMNAKP